MKLKNWKNELKYLEELSNTSTCTCTYKEDTSLKQKLEITIKRQDKLYTEKTKGRQIRSRVKWIDKGKKIQLFSWGSKKQDKQKRL
jgi:hypothetical protein